MRNQVTSLSHYLLKQKNRNHGLNWVQDFHQYHTCTESREGQHIQIKENTTTQKAESWPKVATTIFVSRFIKLKNITKPTQNQKTVWYTAYKLYVSSIYGICFHEQSPYGTFTNSIMVSLGWRTWRRPRELPSRDCTAKGERSAIMNHEPTLWRKQDMKTGKHEKRPSHDFPTHAMIYYTAARSLAKKQWKWKRIAPASAAKWLQTSVDNSNAPVQETSTQGEMVQFNNFGGRKIRLSKCLPAARAPRQLSIKQILKSLNAAKRRFFFEILETHRNSTKKHFWVANVSIVRGNVPKCISLLIISATGFQEQWSCEAAFSLQPKRLRNHYLSSCPWHCDKQC